MKKGFSGKCHNPYFNRWFSAILVFNCSSALLCPVTILILIDGFLQYEVTYGLPFVRNCHNPYFNRWFSAIKSSLTDIGASKLSQSLF